MGKSRRSDVYAARGRGRGWESDARSEGDQVLANVRSPLLRASGTLYFGRAASDVASPQSGWPTK